MTAKVYDLLKAMKPRIVEYKQDTSGPDDPNARVIISFACPKEYAEDLEKFIKDCNEAPDKDTAEIIRSSSTSIIFNVVSDYDFSNKIVEDFF